MKVPRSIWLLALAGLAIRLPFMPWIGFKQDFLFLVSWAEYLAKSSPLHIYADVDRLSVQFVNYPPVYLYILTVLARIYRMVTDAPFNHTAFLLLVKSVTILFELLTAIALYRWTSRRWDSQTGLWAFGLYFLNPAILYVSAYYGQLDAIFCTFLLLSAIAISEGRAFWSGCALAAAFLIKIQTLPFIPLFAGLLLVQRRLKACLTAAVGFALAGLAILFPYIASGQWPALFYECFQRSFEWGKYVSVGAFNLWYLHADPVTFDERIWGFFFDRNGILSVHATLSFLTYKNLGIALFGSAFLFILYHAQKQRDSGYAWIAAMHIALAFFLFPTRVHERYLFPYFVFAAPLAAQNHTRRFFFYAFSITYLINLMVVCPLFGESLDVREIDSALGVWVALANMGLYIAFITYEYVLPRYEGYTIVLWTKTAAWTIAGATLILLWRSSARQENPDVLYLSQIQPAFVEQDWPPIPPELRDRPRTGYEQLKADLSTDGRPLQIGDTQYRYGLGAHAISRVDYDVPGKYQWFECYAGIDAEALQKSQENPDVATATFAVWINGEQRYASPLTLVTTPPRRISIPLPEKREGTNRIRLVVDGTKDGIDSDHADWAMARVIRVTPYNP